MYLGVILWWQWTDEVGCRRLTEPTGPKSNKLAEVDLMEMREICTKVKNCGGVKMRVGWWEGLGEEGCL